MSLVSRHYANTNACALSACAVTVLVLRRDVMKKSDILGWTFCVLLAIFLILVFVLPGHVMRTIPAHP